MALAGVARLTGADTDPETYAIALARHEVAGGLVAPRSVSLRGLVFPRPAATPAAKVAFKEALGRSIDLFNASGGSFRASEDDGVVRLRSRDEPLEATNALKRTVHVERAGVTAFALLRGRVIAALRGAEPSEGFAFAGLMPGPDCLLGGSVRLTEGDHTATDLLDEIVRQVPGLVWCVTYSPGRLDRTLKVGLMSTDGATVSVDVYC
jgi:hypothetical protein